MKRIEVDRHISEEAARQMIGDPAGPLEANVEEEGVWCHEGKPVLMYGPIPSGVADLRSAALGLKWATRPRARGFINASRTFGMATRSHMKRQDSCRATALAFDDPKTHLGLASTSVVLRQMMVDHVPEQLAADEQTMGEVLPEWRLTEGSTWTSGNCNRSSQLPYHVDRANFSTWSAMPVLRRGVRGGFLHIPEFDLVVACRDGWAVFFNGFANVHGVTPMKGKIDDGSYRISLVFYGLRGMKDCHTVALEQARGREVRQGREVNQADPTFDASATFNFSKRNLVKGVTE